jgi:GNAT superfamily N-acetyltransferase
MSTDVTIDELPTPAATGAAGWDDFVAAAEAGHRSDAVAFGTSERDYEPEEELPHFQDPHRPSRMFVARIDGVVVARAWFELQADDPDTAWVVLQVPPEVEHRGIGRGLADAVEAGIAEEGRRKVIVYAPETDAGGERRPAPTGFGSVPEHSRSTRFLDARGYRLEQINRLSRLALPVAGIEAKLAAAVARSGPEFALHSWIGSTPERWRGDIAELWTRMSTDAPDAGVGTPEDVWTAERVATEDARKERDDPRTLVTTAAEHLATGRLAAYTEYSVPPQAARAAQQYGTLVLKEFRGHGLGMLVKLGNLAYLPTASPGHPSALTFNAEENRPMLDVNEAMGFVGIAYEGIWRKDLS